MTQSAPLPAQSRRSTLAPTLALLLLALCLGCGDSVDARLAEAYELQESGQLELSTLAMQRIIRDHPDHEEANFLLGTALVQSDRHKRAIPHLEKAAATSLYAIPAGLLLASTQYRIKSYDEAIASCDRILEIDSDNWTAIYTRALSNLASGQPEQALAQATRILEAKPGAQNAIIMRGNALVDLGRADEAEAIWLDLRESTAAGSNSNAAGRACAELGLFYQSQRKLDQAESVYAECLQAYPTHAYLQDSASDFHVRRSQPERAIAIHRHAADSSPENFQVWSRLAAIMYLHAHPIETHEFYLEIVDRFDSPEAWRLIADFYQKTRHTTAARKAIEEALIRSEQPPEAFLYSLAELLVEEGNLDRAKKLNQRIKKPSYRHLLAGAISLAAGNPQQSLRHVDAGLRLWPNNPNARYLAGRAALELNDHARAIAAFGAATLVGDGATDAALRLAEIHFADGSYASARSFAKHQIASRPHLDASPYHIAIQSALQLNRPDDAREILNSLRVLDPDGLAVVEETASIERSVGGPNASSQYLLSTGVDFTNPANESLLRVFADDLNALGQADEALRLVDLALARNARAGAEAKNVAALHDLRARVASQLGRGEEAVASIDRALAVDPDYAPALETRAALAAEAGDLEAAIAALDAASAVESRESKFLYRAATLANQMGDSDGASFRLKQALARRPYHAMAANDLAWMLATDRKDLDHALELAETAVGRAHGPRTILTLGWVHHRRGEYEIAIKNYRVALETDATLQAARYRLGLALAESGEVSEARKVLNELIRGPEFPELEAARIELARLQDS